MDAESATERDLVLAAIKDNWPTDSNHVPDWHPDDVELHRRADWASFAERSAAVLAQRQGRIADAVVSALAPAPCDLRQQEPYDFAWCETHDKTFPLGSTCPFDGRDITEVYAEMADEQRGRAVASEMKLDMLAGTIEQLAEFMETLWDGEGTEPETYRQLAELLAPAQQRLAAHPRTLKLQAEETDELRLARMQRDHCRRELDKIRTGAVAALMAKMGCKIHDDYPECPSCADGYCRGHGLVYFCTEHDWVEHGHTKTECAYARQLATAVMETTEGPYEVASVCLEDVEDWPRLAEAFGATVQDQGMPSGEYQSTMRWPDGRIAGEFDRLAILSGPFGVLESES